MIRAKIIVALVMPVVAVVICGVLLVATHHTRLPAMSLPPVPSAAPSPSASPSPSSSPAAAQTADFKACTGAIPHPFAGVAVQGDVSKNVAKFVKATHVHHLRVVEYYNRFPGKFQLSEARQVVEAGAVPMVQLNPRNVNLHLIADGHYDQAITAYAQDVKAFSCQVILSFGHEMNGWWYTWGSGYVTPALYKAAWQHIWHIFAKVGAVNAIWSWDPTHQHSQYHASGKTATLASEWYPGDKYVNLIGIDGYLNPNQNFAEVFKDQLANIRSVTNKPIFIAETGVAGNNSKAVAQIAELFAGMRQYHLMGLIWFDQQAKHRWELEGRAVAATAFYNQVASFPSK